MTGFGRAGGQEKDAAWSWEIRSVNNRGLDIRLRLPQGLEEIETRLRDAIGKRIKRGSISIGLTLKAPEAAPDLRLNETLLLKLAEIAERARNLTGHQEPAPLVSLLNMKGVIEIAESDPDATAATASPLAAPLLESFEAALGEIVTVRQAEGARLQAILAEKIAEIEALTGQAEASPERTAEAIAERLRLQIQRLMAESAGFDEARLHQEAVLIATKADIEEELKRLYAHVEAARDLLASDEPIGRKLEFLAQEFQREANTLCSKSNAAEITRIGLRLKSAIDQFREQVQNVE
jgi:uncharacterized protein (TIGR00255 family)